MTFHFQPITATLTLRNNGKIELDTKVFKRRRHCGRFLAVHGSNGTDFS